MKSLFCIALLALAWFAYARSHAPLSYPPGVLVAEEPQQTSLTPNDAAFENGKIPSQGAGPFRARSARFTQKNLPYDRCAALVPVDVAVGWGVMPDQAVLDQLKISQSARFFWYEWQRRPPISQDEIVAHATNLHLIPSSKALETQCESLRSGDLIHLSGLLVEVTGPDIGTWRSSLSRTDSGKGACELVWVEDFHWLAR